MGLLIAVALGLAVAMSWWLVRSITGPLNEAVRVASGLAAGDLAMQIPTGGATETKIQARQLVEAVAVFKLSSR